jgi:glycine betaine/choline ABC-type transport system substrate-binding protein
MDRTTAFTNTAFTNRAIPRKSLPILTAFLLAAALFTSGCGGKAAVVVGSKNFTEQAILGEVVAQQIERRLHVKVERKLNLGGTLVAHRALAAGEIDLYPEYTGTALTAVLKQHPMNDAAAVMNAVRALYRAEYKLDWLEPLGFDNTFAMIVPGTLAREKNLATLSQAAAAQSWKLGIGYEFAGRPDGLDGLLKTYGIHMAAQPATMDLGLLYHALEAGDVNMIAASATDGQISKRDVAVLRDDKNYFPPYQCAIVVNEAAETRVPGLRAALDELSGKISTDTMRQLNYEVDVEHRPEWRVAGEFLDGRFGYEKPGNEKPGDGMAADRKPGETPGGEKPPKQ